MPEDTDPVVDISQLNFDQPLVDIEGVRKVLPQRDEMEMLTAIVHIDADRHVIVGYKDVTPQEFWVRGHMPCYPLMPGVIMLECAAQLTCYYAIAQGVVDVDSLHGLGGIDKARFQRPIRPNDRLVLVGQGIRVNRRMTRFRVTGYVGQEQAFEAEVIGVPIGKWSELTNA